MAIIVAKTNDKSSLLQMLCRIAAYNIMLARFARGGGAKLLPTSYTQGDFVTHSP